MSGITKDTKSPLNGTVVKDSVTGEPTGILKEGATRLLKVRSSVQLTPEESEKRSDEALELALAEARRTGVTSIQQLNGHYKRFQRFKDEGKLTCRVTFNMAIPRENVEERLKKLDELRKEYPPEDNWIRFGYLKVFIDGTLGSGTALMFEPFEDDPGTSGLPMMPYEKYEELIVAADAMGFQTGTHAIGTKGNHWVLNAVEKAMEVNGRRDHRHRSEHAQILISPYIG
jgi:predicted amidohydrolase YtcJ